MQKLQHQLTDRVKFLHKVAITRLAGANQEVLLLQRSSQALSRPGAWDLPGGNSEWPAAEQGSAADLHQADIVREIKEETALTAPANLLTLDHLIYFSSYYDADKQIYTIICGWHLSWSDTDQRDIQISAEHQQLAWVKLDQLDNYDFAGDKGQFVKSIAQRALQQ